MVIEFIFYYVKITEIFPEGEIRLESAIYPKRAIAKCRCGAKINQQSQLHKGINLLRAQVEIVRR
jgi:hypothetical protein